MLNSGIFGIILWMLLIICSYMCLSALLDVLTALKDSEYREQSMKREMTNMREALVMFMETFKEFGLETEEFVDDKVFKTEKKEDRYEA